LGKGSQGVVHACISKESGHKYAVKLINRCNRSAWTTFRREVDMCKQASECPYIVDIVDEFVDSSSCYVVMPKFMSHLRKAFKATSRMPGSGVGLENAALRRLVFQAMTALTHIHSLEIIHRDVKAQNFLADRLDLRDDQGKIVLGDFGLARKLTVGHHLSAQVGTRKYWAPDVYLKRYWHNVDVFGIGVLIFLAGSGTYPYFSEEEACHRDIFAEGILPPILTSEARDFMRLCLVKDPYARPSSEELLTHPWLRMPALDSTSLPEESLTVAHHESESVSTAAPAGSPSNFEASPSALSIGGKLGRAMAVPLPVPMGDDTDNLEASEMEDIVGVGAFGDGLDDAKGEDGEETSMADVEPGTTTNMLDTSPMLEFGGDSFPQSPFYGDEEKHQSLFYGDEAKAEDDSPMDFGDEDQWHFAY